MRGKLAFPLCSTHFSAVKKKSFPDVAKQKWRELNNNFKHQKFNLLGGKKVFIACTPLLQITAIMIG
jgi:hypothetical protein